METSVAPRPEADENEAARERLVYGYSAAAHQLERSTDLLDLARQAAFDPTILDEENPFFWEAVISTDKLDAYYTRMHPSSLKNYAEDAAAGVSFQNSHNTRILPLGRSLTGQYIGGQNPRTQAAFYTLPDLAVSGVNTNDFIRAMKAALVRDVSIGFYGGTIRCSVCNRDFWDWDCRHWPGFWYDAEGKLAQDGDGEMAIGWVHDAHLAEVSAVYDGACPGAEIIKARDLAAAGELPAAVQRLLSVRYRIRLPGTAASFAMTPTGGRDRPVPPDDRNDGSANGRSEGKETDMPKDDREGVQETGSVFGSPALRLLMDAAGLPPAESDEVNLRSLTEALKKLPAIEAERERLAKLADDGRRYRAVVIDAALKAGVQAEGATFPVEEKRALFEGADLALVEGWRDLWASQAKQKAPEGRLTVEGPAPAPAPAGGMMSPNLVYTG